MDYLSTSADISGQIGALEWNSDWESHGDGALESAGADLSPQPITNSLSCIRTFRCIGDGALEAAGANTNGPPQHTNPITGNCPATIHGVIGSPCAGDGELESAAIGLNPTQPVTNPIRFCMTNPIKFCMQTFDCIGDGELESAGEAAFLGGSPTQTNFIYNGRCVSQFDDGELESAAGMGLNPGTIMAGCLHTIPGAGCVGDDALEAAAGLSMNPHPGTNTPACLQTLRLPGGVAGCVSDDVVEAIGATMSPFPTGATSGCYSTRRCVTDAALEAASMAPQVTQNIVCLPRFIDDGALEAVGPATGPKPTSRAMGCPFIDVISDAALEKAAHGPGQTQWSQTPVRCIGDAALEAAGASVAADASINVGCPPRTALCGH